MMNLPQTNGHNNTDRSGPLSDSLPAAGATPESKNFTAELMQSQKMEAIGALAGGIAHDFNNILFPISGYIELMLEDLPQESPHRKSLHIMRNAVTRASELVRQILSFTRQTEHEIQPIKIQFILKEVVALIKSTLPATIQIRTRIQKDCPQIMADPIQIHQIIMNLVTNAYHAMERSGGRLDISLSECAAADLPGNDIASEHSSRYARITIRDSGVGMDRETMARIFEPYFTTKDANRGTGIGLAVVHYIVNTYNGKIDVSSEPGQGTCFSIFLPALETRLSPNRKPMEEKIQGGTESILIVDDEAAIVKMLQKSLERLGYRTTGLVSSIDALAAFQDKPDAFDLVISDLTMPLMTGVELTKQIMAIRPDIPIIICTGFSEQLNAEQAEEMGIHAFIMKPIIMRKLTRTIRKVLDAQRQS